MLFPRTVLEIRHLLLQLLSLCEVPVQHDVLDVLLPADPQISPFYVYGNGLLDSALRLAEARAVLEAHLLQHLVALVVFGQGFRQTDASGLVFTLRIVLGLVPSAFQLLLVSVVFAFLVACEQEAGSYVVLFAAKEMGLKSCKQ